jgi:hypothetical protein
MKYRFYAGLMLGAVLLAGGPCALRAQTFSVPWFVAAGGGGTAAAGSFSLTGTFGQLDANTQPMTAGVFSLSSGFWSFLATEETALFSDDFSGNSVDPTKWTASGHTVIETNGMMEVLNTVTDDGGVLSSVPFAVNSTGLTTITREVFLHAQPGSQPNYTGNYFMGQFVIGMSGLAPFSVNYANMDYGDGVTYMPRHGFFLARDGQSPLYIADQGNVSAAIPPLWDTWFNEKVTYDPSSGVMEYFINDASQMTFNVGALPTTNSPTMMLSFNASGWGTGHEQLFKDLYVTQAGAANGTMILSLSGNLAFGGVAVGTTSNQTLTLSNAGNAALTVSNISYSPGFSGAWSGTIAAGGSQPVTVTFSPTAATNYTGTVTVNSDATSSVDTIPISGFGSNGTLVLTLITNGDGVVSPNLAGRLLTAGRNYTLEAHGRGGDVFSDWSGITNSTRNPLTFTMEPGTVLQANFIPSPFVPVKGTYYGLFSTTNGVSEETAGLLKGLTVGVQGGYSGSLLINGRNLAISGTFDLTGQASNHISLPVSQGGPLLVEMTLSNSSNAPPQVTGTISGTNNGVPWVANLVANRATNQGSARYTMVLAPTEFGLPGVPSGYGYVLLAKHAGVLSLSGALADGAAFTQNVPVDETGQAPVFANLYGRTGLLMGWVNMAGGALAGNLDWIKPAARSGLYSNGFTNVVIAQGSSWTNQSPAAAIDLPVGQLNLSGGNLSSPLSFVVAVSNENALTILPGSPTNALTVSINPKTGLLTAIFDNGAGGAKTIGKGAVLQETTNAAGFFLDKTNAGSVILEP